MAISYSTPTTLEITAGGLASAANRCSAAVTTSTDANVTAILLEVAILTTAVAPAGNKQVRVYAYASTDGVNFEGNTGITANIDGTDKTLLGLGSNLVYVGRVVLDQGASVQTVRKTFALTNSFGYVPPKWGIILYNDAGTALGGMVSVQYREVSYS